MTYEIKKIPEDFVVKEIPSFTFNKTNGKYLIYKLKKIKRNTEDCIQFLSKKLNIPRKYFGFAGTKDRNAITEQFISVYNIQNLKNRIQGIKSFENFSLEFIGYYDKPISLGDLKSNRFEITIRNLDENISIRNPNFIVNYFDEQRFSKNNKEIGKLLIKKDFKTVVELLKKQNQINDEAIESYKSDYIKIIRHIPLKILKLFIHAYQSFLFNEICKENLKRKNYPYAKIEYSQGELFFALKEPRNFKIQIIGFGTETNANSEIIEKILEKEKINFRDFIIKQIPELSSFGTERDFIIEIFNFSASELLDDELNIGKKKVKVCFDLPKGAYATIVIKKIMLLTE